MSSAHTLARLLVLLWMIPWITAVPLFHIHLPDKTDQWSAIQSGGAHTVYTRDLQGEFTCPIRDTHTGHATHLSHRVVNSPELGMVLSDEKSKKLTKLCFLGVPSCSPASRLLGSLAFTFPCTYSNSHLCHGFLLS